MFRIFIRILRIYYNLKFDFFQISDRIDIGPRSEMDIMPAFGAGGPGSNPGEGTLYLTKLWIYFTLI